MSACVRQFLQESSEVAFGIVFDPDSGQSRGTSVHSMEGVDGVIRDYAKQVGWENPDKEIADRLSDLNSKFVMIVKVGEEQYYIYSAKPMVASHASAARLKLAMQLYSDTPVTFVTANDSVEASASNFIKGLHASTEFGVVRDEFTAPAIGISKPTPKRATSRRRPSSYSKTPKDAVHKMSEPLSPEEWKELVGESVDRLFK